MAKSKRRKSAVPKKSPPEPPAVQRALQNLRDFYEDGLPVIEATEATTGGQLDPKQVAKTFARQRGVYPDHFWQARKFAQAYSENQFDELCSLRRPDGKPLSPTHIPPAAPMPESRIAGHGASLSSRSPRMLQIAGHNVRRVRSINIDVPRVT